MNGINIKYAVICLLVSCVIIYLIINVIINHLEYLSRMAYVDALLNTNEGFFYIFENLDKKTQKMVLDVLKDNPEVMKGLLSHYESIENYEICDMIVSANSSTP